MADSQNNNYNNAQNTDPGFTTGNNTIPGQQGGMSLAPGGPGVIQLLQSLLSQTSDQGQSQGGMSVAGGGQAPMTQSVQSQSTPPTNGANPVTGLTNDHIDALRGVIAKANKSQAEQFYQQNPQGAQALVNQHDAVMGNQSSGQAQPATSAQPAQAPAQNPAPQAQPMQNNAAPGGNIAPSPQNQQFQQQASNLVNPNGFHPLGALLNTLGLVTGVGPGLENLKTQKLDNIAKAQQINWGTPEGQTQLAQAAQTNAQTEMQNLTNKGQKPIDPEQYLTAYSGMYQKAYDAYSKDEDTGNQITQSSLDAYNKLADTTRNAVQKGLGQSTPQMKAAMQSAAATLKASIDARSNFHDFMLNNSPSQVIGSIKNKISQNSSNGPSSSAQNVTQMLQPGQAKNINGNMIKRLK